MTGRVASLRLHLLFVLLLFSAATGGADVDRLDLRQVDTESYALSGVVTLHLHIDGIDSAEIGPADVAVVQERGEQPPLELDVVDVAPAGRHRSWFVVMSRCPSADEHQALEELLDDLEPIGERMGVAVIDEQYQLLVPLTTNRARVARALDRVATNAGRAPVFHAALRAAADAVAGRGRHYVIAVGDSAGLRSAVGSAATVLDLDEQEVAVALREADTEFAVTVRLPPDGGGRRRLLVSVDLPDDVVTSSVVVDLDSGPLLRTFGPGTTLGRPMLIGAAAAAVALWVIVWVVVVRARRKPGDAASTPTD